MRLTETDETACGDRVPLGEVAAFALELARLALQLLGLRNERALVHQVDDSSGCTLAAHLGFALAFDLAGDVLGLLLAFAVDLLRVLLALAVQLLGLLLALAVRLGGLLLALIERLARVVGDLFAGRLGVAGDLLARRLGVGGRLLARRLGVAREFLSLLRGLAGCGVDLVGGPLQLGLGLRLEASLLALCLVLGCLGERIRLRLVGVFDALAELFKVFAVDDYRVSVWEVSMRCSYATGLCSGFVEPCDEVTS